MTPATLVLALLPPVLAGFVEFCSPLGDSYFRNSVSNDLRRVGQQNNETLQEVMVKSHKAAAELAGLAPTIVSCIATSFSVVHEVSGELWWMLAYMSVFIVFVLFILKMLIGRSLFDLDDRAVISFRRLES